jgi:hypothetical protein
MTHHIRMTRHNQYLELGPAIGIPDRINEVPLKVLLRAFHHRVFPGRRHTTAALNRVLEAVAPLGHERGLTPSETLWLLIAQDRKKIPSTL